MFGFEDSFFSTQPLLGNSIYHLCDKLLVCQTVRQQQPRVFSAVMKILNTDAQA